MSGHLARPGANGRSPALFARRPRALLIDAGFTLVSYDGTRIAQIAAATGFTVDPAAVEGSEPTMRAELAQHDWPQQPGSEAPAAGGARFFRRVLQLASGGADGPVLDRAAEAIWSQHMQSNLWSRPLPGVVPALEALGRAGVRLAVVSNSEGTLVELLERIDMARHFHAIVDSWVLGVTKPDQRIFQTALDRVQVGADDAIMVGDSIKADILGAQAAGIRAALIDPCDLYREALVPRFATFAAFAEAVLRGEAVADPASG